MPSQHRLRVAVLARSVYPLHGVGGLERHVYDLVRHLIAHDVHVTLITKPPLVPTPTPPRERGGTEFLAEAAAPARPAAGRDATGRPVADRTGVTGRTASAAADSAARARPDADATGVAGRAARATAGGPHGSSADIDTGLSGSAGDDSMPADSKSDIGEREGGAPSQNQIPPRLRGGAGEGVNAAFGVPPEMLRFIEVPYVTFPGAGRRGTTVADRISAYPFFGWRAGKVAAKLAYQGEVDVVYALGASGLGYAMARRRHEATKPFVFNPQGLEEFGGTNPEHARLKRIAYGPLQSAVRSCARAADSVIATDRSLVPTLLRHLPIDLAHIDVVPNGIDLHAIDQLQYPAVAELRARANIPAEASLLVSVGRLEANKGFHVFARALALLQQRQPDLAANLYWVLAGDGPFRGEIEHAAQAAGVGSRMIIAGRVSDEELHGWYEAADLFVHPTLYEGSSLVTLEAMAHARPVLATRAGGLPDKVTPDENGWLVDPDRPDQLADAVAAALQLPPDTRAAMGRASRARVEREFAWPVIADTMIAVYRRLIAAEERV